MADVEKTLYENAHSAEGDDVEDVSNQDGDMANVSAHDV